MTTNGHSTHMEFGARSRYRAWQIRLLYGTLDIVVPLW